jgi:hypothetical protein
MIDPEKEELRPLTRASRDVPGRPHLATLFRWSRKGIRGVRLVTMVIGGRRFTSVQAVGRFLARLNEPATLPDADMPKKTQEEFSRLLSHLLDDLGFDVTHRTRATEELERLLRRLRDEGIVTRYSIDSYADRVSVAVNKMWFRQTQDG